MSSEMGSLIQRHGGVPYPAPAMQELYLKDSPEVQQLVHDICNGQLDAVVFLTGVGTQALLEVAESLGRKDELIQSLDGLTVIARSPKPGRVLRRNKIHIDAMPPEPYTSQDLMSTIDAVELAGKKVAVQHYGGPNKYLVEGLQERGASVREVTLYTWGLPEDDAPVLRLIDDLAAGAIDAVAFTSQPQVGNLLTIAAKAGKEAALRESLEGPVLVASVGPVCSRRLREAGFTVDLEPEHPHMGSLVVALAEHFENQAATAGT